jgi:hypothetical protein
MVTRKGIIIKICILFITFSLNFVFSYPIPDPNKVQVQEKELELRFFFPDKEQEEKEIYLDRPQRVSADESGHVYFSCIGNHSILKFDDEGKFIKTIGRAGQGPGEFQGPNHVVPWRDKLIVLDNFSRKFQILDSDGAYLSSFIIQSTYWDFVVTENGFIYAAPLLYPFPGKKEKDLIHVYNQGGELKSVFGKPKDIDETFFNMVRLAVNYKNDILVAFEHWPEIRKYTAAGELIAEYTIDHPVMEERAKFNRKQITAPKKMGEPGRAQTCIEDIEVLENRIFLYYRSYEKPLLEILEFDPEMNLVTKYFYKSEGSILGGDFFVRKKGDNLFFYFLNRREDRIIVLCEKR